MARALAVVWLLRSIARVGLAAAALACATLPARAREPTPVKREILALYDGSQEGQADFTRIHRFAELPLNHLGLILRFRDVRDDLPEAGELARYLGVLTWFAGPIPHGDAYLAWAKRAAQRPLRFVILGDVGIAIDSANLSSVNQLLASAGVRHTGEYVSPTLGVRVTQRDPSLIEFECRLGPVLPDYPITRPAAGIARAAVTLETPSYRGARIAVPVAIGANGGYAGWNFEMCHQRPPLYQSRWLINPFDFFRAAFACAGEPVPDTTTASGNRLYFSILDSEGLTRQSKIEAFEDTPAGEVDLGELIKPFPDLPTNLDLHGDELTKAERPGSAAQTLLRKILAEPQVQLLRRPMQATLSRYDFAYPSIANLSPLLSAGPQAYVNKPMSDESAYVGASPVGQNHFPALAATIANTDRPRRLAPLDLNAHAYTGEYPAQLRAVKELLAKAHDSALTPVSANRYAAIVDGFFSARVDRIGDSIWRISGRGALQTVRFDDSGGLEVDDSSSEGVIGARKIGSTLYVALDEAVEPAIVALAPAATIKSDAPLTLVESRWLVRKVKRDRCNLRFEAEGYGDGSFLWTGASGRSTISVERAGVPLWRGSAQADEAGRLAFTLPISAVASVAVEVACADPARPDVVR